MVLLHSFKSLGGLVKTTKNYCFVISRLLHGYGKQPIEDPLKSQIIPFVQLPEYQNAFKKLTLTSNASATGNFVQFMELDKLIFDGFDGFSKFSSLPSTKKESVEEPLYINAIVEEPESKILPLLTFPKSDIKWRKRKMRRHRLLRWRAKYPQIVRAMEEKKLKNRKEKQEENLQKSWEMFGLDSKPPELTEEEKSRFLEQWREEGIWTDGLTIEEYKSFEKITSIMKATDKK